MTNREFIGEDWTSWKQDYDNIMAWRKTIKGKPDEYDRLLVEMYKDWAAFYRRWL